MIHERDWDCLVILDACPYDYFEKVYEDYSDGKLQKVISAGYSTLGWLKETFGDSKHSGIIYVSGTAYVNSRGLEVIEGFIGVNHFYKVIDVWDHGWSEELETVLPERMSKATRLARAKYPSKRLISHFNQPHYPHLSIGSIREITENSAFIPAKKGIVWERSLVDKVRGFAGTASEEILGAALTCRVRDILNLRRSKPCELIAREYGDRTLYEAYENNLRAALAEVKKLAERLPGKTVVTSDHGELLGEDGLYGHGWRHPLLREVPWLEVEK
ncbi:hypothetical protein AKJ44_01685 [candidate division MSBL1 archaeon SCGC-AAA261F17]|uniref:Sulfatase N-terminal domain-containing protein n=1 Tax=candidate division MSBL1 archaeon SCGC-AAA261F17 TaxID=1698274 RepID=A0A133V6C9_9EURY|nr:hypothetical protein AKJ44_01685 [candidate division MSBL1 archaeon SCGC-AAA261F17]